MNKYKTNFNLGCSLIYGNVLEDFLVNYEKEYETRNGNITPYQNHQFYVHYYPRDNEDFIAAIVFFQKLYQLIHCNHTPMNKGRFVIKK
jgi:hypothetical protein